MFRIGLGKSSFIPDKDIRILRELTRYRYKLKSMRSGGKNRFQNALAVCNVALDSVMSDMFGKSATAITDYLISDEDFDARHCVSLLHRSLKKKRMMYWPLLSVMKSRWSRNTASALSVRVDMPEPLKEKRLAKTVKQTVRFLETQSLTVLDSACPLFSSVGCPGNPRLTGLLS